MIQWSAIKLQPHPKEPLWNYKLAYACSTSQLKRAENEIAQKILFQALMGLTVFLLCKLSFHLRDHACTDPKTQPFLIQNWYNWQCKWAQDRPKNTVNIEIGLEMAEFWNTNWVQVQVDLPKTSFVWVCLAKFNLQTCKLSLFEIWFF